MKKTAFLIISAVAILLSGCAGSSYDLSRVASIGNAMINTNTSHPPESNDDRGGVCLSLSSRLSLSIDIDGILDYVQGESTFTLENERLSHMSSPWISWNLSY